MNHVKKYIVFNCSFNSYGYYWIQLDDLAKLTIEDCMRIFGRDFLDARLVGALEYMNYCESPAKLFRKVVFRRSLNVASCNQSKQIGTIVDEIMSESYELAMDVNNDLDSNARALILDFCNNPNKFETDY